MRFSGKIPAWCLLLFCTVAAFGVTSTSTKKPPPKKTTTSSTKKSAPAKTTTAKAKSTARKPAPKATVATAKSTAKKPAPRYSSAAARRSRVPVVRTSAAQRTHATAEVQQFLNTSSDATIEQAGTLVPFFERLYRMDAKILTDPVHIVHFGDSHTAADEWTGRLRSSFQGRFGDGGSGFSVAGYPFAGYRRFDARGGATTRWRSEGLRAGAGDGWFGLGGVSITADRPGQSVYLDGEGSFVEIQYLRQPGGGQFAFYDNDQLRETVSTDGELSPGYAAYQINPGPHRFTLRTVDSNPVRLFGWVVDRTSGVTYEALGINGAEAAVILHWNQEMLATYLQRRDPGLIVLAYGTNEASDSNWREPGTYYAMLTQLLQRLREAAPAASILVVGPGDRWMRTRAGWRTVPGIDSIITAQRAACHQFGCAFWDTRKRMGGEGAMLQWVYAGLAQGDRVHFTQAGYQRLGDILYADVMAQYEIFLKARQQVAQEPHGNENTKNP